MDIYEKAVLESLGALRDQIIGVENLVVVAGLGGGTGTGAASVVIGIIGAECCKSVTAIVIKPSAFEALERLQQNYASKSWKDGWAI